MLGDYLDQYTYEYLLETALARVPNTVDKREGSIIYDAIAPAMFELAQAYVELKYVMMETYVLTATDKFLEQRVLEQGLTRHPATYAVKRALLKDSQGSPKAAPTGTRFTTLSTDNPVNYIVMGPWEDESGQTMPGVYQLKCEAPGITGNEYVGSIMPISFVYGLAEAYMDILLIPARDAETDEELRTRYLMAVNNKPFGGNIAQYDEEIQALPGVGEVQIYPVWNGGGTVKCSIIGADFNTASQTLIDEVQTAVDPEINQGIGLGLAPIGHTVTITTPKEVPIHITASVKLYPGYVLGQVEGEIKKNISDYLLTLRKNWGVADSLNRYSVNIYAAQINYAILGVAGVANASAITINGAAADLELKENALLQELPMLGAVTIHEA